MIYVHVNEQNKPWIDAVSTTAQEGYVAKPALLNSQIVALMNFPDKCYVDDSGAVITPNQIPLSQAEQQSQEATLTINDLKQKITDLTAEINQANADKQALQSQIAGLMVEISKLQQPATNGGAK